MKRLELKKRLQAGEVLFGTFFKGNAPTLVEVLGYAGLDFIIVDQEHSAIQLGDLEQIVRAADNVDLPTLVRIPSPLEEHILHALDIGCCGIQAPGLKSAQEAAQTVAYGKYYPQGCRGLTYNQRAARYGFCDKEAYRREQNETNLFVIQVENADMLEHVEGLSQIEGVDVIFIGPMDLSTSLGVSGQVDHPLVQEAIQRTVRAASAAGKGLGIFITKPNDIKKYIDMGFQYIVWSSDVGFCIEGAAHYMEQVKDWKK